MLEFNNKKKLRKIIYSPVAMSLLVIIFLIVFRAVWGVYNKFQLSKQNLIKDKTEMAKLLTREKGLTSSLDYLKTEQGIESEIRTKFRAVKGDEKLAVIVEDEKLVPTPIDLSEKRGFWTKVYAIIFGL